MRRLTGNPQRQGQGQTQHEHTTRTTATRQARYNNPIMKGTHTEVITVDPAIATPAKVPAKGFT